MVAEACQESGTLYTGSTYNGYGDIYHKNLTSGPYVSLCDITPPWGGTLTDELLTEDVPKTYSSGTERYVITMHDAFIGAETKSAEFTECWYTDDGNRYVKTGGSDSALGTTWNVAWKTNGYGFQNIPSGKDLYVEEGLYGDETLSNLDPPQTMEMYIQPEGHTEAPCNVWVSDDTVFSDGYISGAISATSHDGVTLIDPNSLVTQTGVIVGFSYYAPSGVNSVKFKIFRSDGTYYTLIGESELYTFSESGWNIYNKCNIAVQPNDILGIYLSGTANIGRTNSALVYKSKNGDIGGTTRIVLWADWIYTHQIAMQAHGYY